MKLPILIFFMIFFSSVCSAQNDWEKLSDSMAIVSRTKADRVLENFDTVETSKLLYSLEDRYFYHVIRDSAYYKEYYIVLDSLGLIDKVRPVIFEVKTRKQRRQHEEYRRFLSKVEPIFDLSKYHTDFITRIPDAKIVSGKPSYFVVKGPNNNRYGEYSLSSLTVPTPIDSNLWVYLVRRLSEEVARDMKATQ